MLGNGNSWSWSLQLGDSEGESSNMLKRLVLLHQPLPQISHMEHNHLITLGHLLIFGLDGHVKGNKFLSPLL